MGERECPEGGEPSSWAKTPKLSVLRVHQEIVVPGENEDLK